MCRLETIPKRRSCLHVGVHIRERDRENRGELVDCVKPCLISSIFQDSVLFLSLFIQLGLPGSVQVVSLRCQLHS